MKLPADKLAAHVAKGLQPLYVLCGDEPLLSDEALAHIRERAPRDGCTERETHVAERSFDWGELEAGLQNLSLFASRRLVELRLPTGKPGTAGAEFITKLCTQATDDNTGNVLVFLLPALDSQTTRSKWAGALAGAAVWVDLKPPARDQLPAWLGRRLKSAGLTADDAAIDMLAARVEGNLLAAKQEIDKLALLVEDGRVTPDAVRAAVADGARFDVFQLSDAALSGDVARVVRVLHGLQREGEAEVLVLWTLARDILTLSELAAHLSSGRNVEQAMSDAGIWRSRQDLFRRAVRGRSPRDVQRLVRSAARADQVVKGMRPGNAWNALLELSLQLGGARPALAETA